MLQRCAAAADKAELLAGFLGKPAASSLQTLLLATAHVARVYKHGTAYGPPTPRHYADTRKLAGITYNVAAVVTPLTL